MEHSLLVIKPHAVEAGASLRIMQVVESHGLAIRHICQRMMTLEEAQKIYASYQGKEYYQGSIDALIASPVVMLVVEGEDAVETLYDVSGHMDPAMAEAETLRASFGVDINHNAVYTPDCADKARKDISILFPGLILASFERKLEERRSAVARAN